MGKINPTRGGTARGGSMRGGKTRGSASSRGPLTSKGIATVHGGGTTPIRNTAVARIGSTNRGKGNDLLNRTKDGTMEKNSSKRSERKVYKVNLTNAIVKKLITAKSKGAHMKINASDKMDRMEINTGEGERIQLNLSSPKKVEMIFIRNDGIEFFGKVIGYANNTPESHVAAKREQRDKKMKERYEKSTKGKRQVQVLGYKELLSEQEAKTRSKRQKNNSGSSIKVQQSSPTTLTQAQSGKVVPQLSNATRGGKPLRGKARGGRIRTTVATEVVDSEDVVEATVATASARVGNIIRGGKTTGVGKATRSRGAKTIINDASKVNLITTPSTTSTRGKRGRPAGITNRTTRGAKTYTTTTRTSAAPKTSVIGKNDNEQHSMSEGTTPSFSKKGKSKVNEQPVLSVKWKPGQTITILAEFKQARKICEDMENDIQEVIEELSVYDSFYHTYSNSIKNATKGGFTHDYLLREIEKIEKQFGEGSPANKLMQKYLQLEKDIKIIYDELWRAANEGPVCEN